MVPLGGPLPRWMPKPYRHTKTGIWWIKGANPPDIAERTGAKQYRRSLGVRDPAALPTAISRFRLALEEAWAAIRSGPQDITKRQAVAIAGEAYRDWMARHGDNPPPVPFDAVAALLEHAIGPEPAVTFKVDAVADRLKAKGLPWSRHRQRSKRTGKA